MWVTSSQAVEALKPSSALGLLNGFTHNLSHRLNGLNSPLTWVYIGFPQLNPLVTTTTYNYIKTPVRFPLPDFLKAHLFKDKNLQSFTTERRLTK
jgi:hypothetical protein